MARVKESREYQLSLWKQMEEDKQKEVRFGVDRTDDSANLIKNVLTQIERKTEEDFA
jgi:hypothetical protein